MNVAFDPGFAWGVATSAYQVEGATDADGRQESIWDAFTRVPGAIAGGQDGTTAADHYHRMAEDVAIMADLGVGYYRFSVSWPRVMHADGTLNTAGVGFYDRLVDTLLEAGITPWLTLYHWDLPTSLPGGWLNRDTARAMAAYAVAVHGVLGDRVRIWTTVNEPWCSAVLGHGTGQHAPGHADPWEAFTATHHLLLAHGMTTRALREIDSDARLGLTLNFTPALPADPGNPADVDVASRIDATAHRMWLDPLFRGGYPDDVIRGAGRAWPADAVRDGDLPIIGTPVDLLGVNFYTTDSVRARLPGEAAPGPLSIRGRRIPSANLLAPDAVVVDRGLPRTAMGWEIDPTGLRDLLLRLHRGWTGPAGIPLFVTENGGAFPDHVADDAAVHDDDRIDYLRGHLAATREAIEEGADVRGYFLWSLVDNFEWAEGYARTFGLCRLDESGGRHLKDSARWYSSVCRSGGFEG